MKRYDLIVTFICGGLFIFVMGIIFNCTWAFLLGLLSFFVGSGMDMIQREISYGEDSDSDSDSDSDE